MLRFSWLLNFLLIDLRDDRQFFVNHPGAVPITTAQVFSTATWVIVTISFLNYSCYIEKLFHKLRPTNGIKTWFSTFLLFWGFFLKGEELKKLIGAPVYIECSSKTQQVCNFNSNHLIPTGEARHDLTLMTMFMLNTPCECRMWKQSLTQPLKWFSSHQNRRRKRRERHRRPVLYCEHGKNSVGKKLWLISHLSINALQSLSYFSVWRKQQAGHRSFDWQM